MRIPFDNVALAAIVTEIEPFVGAIVQGVQQPDENTLYLRLYHQAGDEHNGREAMVLLSIHPQLTRTHFVTRRPAKGSDRLGFGELVQARLLDHRLSEVRQFGCDRVLGLGFAGEGGGYVLFAELMGKTSNLILVDLHGQIVSAAKTFSSTQAPRAVQPKREYEWPPVVDLATIADDSPSDPASWIKFAQSHPHRVSPFFRRLVEAGLSATEWEGRLIAGEGAYPLPLDSLGVASAPRLSFSIALEQFSAEAAIQLQIRSLRSGLEAQLGRALESRRSALVEVENTLEQDQSAADWTRRGELILAYGAHQLPGVAAVEAFDYDGGKVTLPVDPELGHVENAKRYFERSKRAKARMGHLAERRETLKSESQELDLLIARVQSALRITELQEMQEFAKSRRWLQQTGAPAKTKEEKPFEGHRIRELVGPGGVRVLYGENATSNDYLTLRVATPDDYWLHVRGSTSAHVVIATEKGSRKIGQEQLIFAAKVAVQNSSSKHSGYVPVDYTLKRFVRKPKGAPVGSAVYTREKTLHVEA